MQSKLINKEEAKRQQASMKEKQKRINELLKKNDEASKREMDSLQKEMLESMNAMMQGNMKYMMYSMIVFLPAFAIIGFLYGKEVISLPFPVPLFHRNLSFELTSRLSWIWWYIYGSLVSSLVISAIMKIVEKVKKKETVQKQ
jgi:uncharacterized membrane protein (DUF106 family)